MIMGIDANQGPRRSINALIRGMFRFARAPLPASRLSHLAEYSRRLADAISKLLPATCRSAVPSRSVARGLLATASVALAVSSAPASAAAPIPTTPARHVFDFTGQGAGGLSLPSDVAVNADGRAYVVDGGNHRVVAFDKNGKYLFAFGQKGSAAGQFRDPVGIGIDGRGRLYVADKGNHRIQIFGPEGSFQGAFAVTEAGHAVRPIDVAPDPTGSRIYVTGNNNHRVMEFTANGTPVRAWGEQGEATGQFRFPASIHVGPSGGVFVVDVLNSRAQGFNSEGTWMVQVGTWGILPGQLFRPKGLAVDAKGRIFIGDSYMDVIQIFDDEGHFLHVLGNKGTPQRFVSAGGISAGPNNRLYVAEMLRNKVSVYVIE